MLQDTHGRRFYYLRLSITEACNFRCQYCLPDGYQPTGDKFMSEEEIHTVVKAFAGLGTRKVRITGGEPSLRRDLTSIIRNTASTDGIQKIAMTTHGARLADNAVEWAQAGLNQVNVSIDSLDPRQFASITGHDSLKRILAGIEKAMSIGLKVKVNAVLMRDILKSDWSYFLDWIKDKPITLRFIELMETGDHPEFFAQHHMRGEPIKQKLLQEGWEPILKTLDAGPAQEFVHPDYSGKLGLILPYSKDFCTDCNRLRIAATGKLHLCLFAENGLDIRPIIKEGDVAALQAHLRALLADKKASHYLHDGNTGATRHLAMLGG